MSPDRPSLQRSELTQSELRQVQLRLLGEVANFCDKAGLRYYLGWGTLLGAVRHGGYIPWDDDIDLIMFRDDYNEFSRTFEDSMNREDVELKGAFNTPGWPYPFFKVVDVDTEVVEHLDHDVPLGVNIDIFPVDGTPESKALAHLHRLEIAALRNILVLRTMTPRHGRSRLKHLIQQLAAVPLAKIDSSFFVRLWEVSARRHTAQGASQVGVRVGPLDWTVHKEALGTPTDISFEGNKYSGPADPHAVLTAIYGDYMTPPAPEKQVTHHRFRAYWA